MKIVNLMPESKTCVYCDDPTKETKIWKETNEYVCYDCREDFLNEEFKDKFGLTNSRIQDINTLTKSMRGGELRYEQ